MPPECAIGECGVLAVGRCQSCDQAFCPTHQAREGRTKFVDLCSICQAREREERISATEDRERSFLRMVCACESRPFPRLLAGAALATTFDPPRKVPWELYDRQFVHAPKFDDRLCERLARDFVAEAEVRDVWPERRVRSRQRETKGRIYKRTAWKDIHGDGWLLESGSSWKRGGKTDGLLDAIVWVDGAITSPHHDNCRVNFSGEALLSMAQVLGINTTTGRLSSRQTGRGRL